MKKYPFLSKRNFLIATFCLYGLTGIQAQNETINKETPAKFKQRMEWFTNAKFGMFIHLGLYSSLGGEYQGKQADGYAEWIQSTLDIPSAEYALLANSWNPRNFDADLIARTAKKADMKYIVITTKHHEGFCLWNSRYTDFIGRPVIRSMNPGDTRNRIINGKMHKPWSTSSKTSMPKEETCF